MSRNPPRIRRIVTGHDANGKTLVLRDSDATNHKYPDAKVSSTLIWVTDAAPAEFLGDEDAGDRILGTAPPEGGTRFCVMEFEPGNAVHGLHRTDTVDYVICLAGAIDMDLDEGTVTLCTGDIMVQRGTNHAWVNRGSAPARLAVVLIDGKPKRPGSIGGTANAR
jgi:quercetin dioxygenase-like cupin family protein